MLVHSDPDWSLNTCICGHVCFPELCCGGSRLFTQFSKFHLFYDFSFHFSGLWTQWHNLPGNLHWDKFNCIEVMFSHPDAKKSRFYSSTDKNSCSVKVSILYFPAFSHFGSWTCKLKKSLSLSRRQQKKDFAMANRSVKSNRDLPKRLWRVGEVHTNLEISMLSFLLLGKSLDLFEEDKSTKYEKNNSRTLCKIQQNIPQSETKWNVETH